MIIFRLHVLQEEPFSSLWEIRNLGFIIVGYLIFGFRGYYYNGMY